MKGETACDMNSTGALIMTDTILRVTCYKYSAMYPKILVFVEVLIVWPFCLPFLLRLPVRLHVPSRASLLLPLQAYARCMCS